MNENKCVLVYNNCNHTLCNSWFWKFKIILVQFNLIKSCYNENNLLADLHAALFICARMSFNVDVLSKSF